MNPTAPSSLRCSLCAVNWPVTSDFTECPQCGEPTSTMMYAEPMDLDEANRKLAYARWEEWQVEHDRV